MAAKPYTIVGGVYRSAPKHYVVVNGVYRKVKTEYEVVNGVYRKCKSGSKPIKIASNVTSGTFDISQCAVKEVQNFIIDVKNGNVNSSRQLRSVSAYVSKSVSGNNLSVNAKVECSLGNNRWEGSFTFDIWYIEDPTSRYLGTSPVDVSGISSNINDFACQPVYCTGYDAGSNGYTGGRVSRSLSNGILSATTTVYAAFDMSSPHDLATTNSNIYYVGD